MSSRRSAYTIAVGMALRLFAVVAAPVAGVEATTANLMVNPGFEEGVDSDGLPVGWPTVFAGKWGENFELSPVSLAGDWSLKVVDPDQKTGVGLRSTKVAIEGGKQYMASVKVYNAESATGSLYLEFWNEAGNRVLAPFEWRPGDKDVWTEIVVVAEAPSNAKYATLLLYSSSIAVGTVYFDEVSLMALD